MTMDSLALAPLYIQGASSGALDPATRAMKNRKAFDPIPRRGGRAAQVVSGQRKATEVASAETMDVVVAALASVGVQG